MSLMLVWVIFVQVASQACVHITCMFAGDMFASDLLFDEM